jgi:hypothetical protein
MFVCGGILLGVAIPLMWVVLTAVYAIAAIIVIVAFLFFIVLFVVKGVEIADAIDILTSGRIPERRRKNA